MEIKTVHIIVAVIALLHPIAVFAWAYFYKSPTAEESDYVNDAATGVVSRRNQPSRPENSAHIASEREQAARLRRRVKGTKESASTKKRPRSRRIHVDEDNHYKDS